MSANRTRENTTTTGTGGVITLNGAVDAHASFNEYYAGSASNVQYTIEEGDDYEVGIGDFTAPNTFTSTTVYEKKEGGVYTKSPGTRLNLLGGAQIFVGIPKEEIDDKANLSTDNLFAGENTASGFIKSAVSKIVASSVDVLRVPGYDTRLDTDNGAWRKKSQWTSWYAANGAFPESSQITVEGGSTDTVSVYITNDADTPLYKVWTLTNPTSAKALDGKIIIGTSVGVVTIDLVKDQVFLHDTSGVSVADQNVENFNMSTVAWVLVDAAAAIVNNTVNDVAITAPSGAETDPNRLGLPYPTIAVGMDGGLSVINHDGSAANENDVVDITTDATVGSEIFSVSFYGERLAVAWNSVAAGTRYTYTYDIPNVDTTASGAFSVTQLGDFSSSPDLHWNGTGRSQIVEGVGSDILALATNSGPGVNLFQEDTTTPANGMVAYITTTYNTGWMPGDIRGAWLANSKTADRSVKGNTLTENGTVPETDVDTGAELKFYGPYTATINQTRTSDIDWDVFGTTAVGIDITFQSTGTATDETLFSIANAGNTVRLNVMLMADGTVDVIEDGATASVTTSSTVAYDDGVTHKIQYVRTSSVARELFVDDVSVASNTTDAGSLSDSGNLPLAIGVDADGSTLPALTTKLAFVKLTAYAKTDAQVSKVNNDERKLFQPNALSTLQGASNSVQGLSHDEDTDKLDAATDDGTTTIIGLQPIDYIDSAGIGTSDDHKAVSRVDDQLSIATAAESIFSKPSERL